jgi:Flp pilus assembly protein TadG
MPKIVMNPLQTAKSAKSYKSIPLNLSQPFALCASSRGQTLVEFSLIFVLFLVIVWIPVDFGLAFYSSQLAQNAAREGARIASADPTLTAINSTCAMPACYSFGNLFNETATRVPPALLTGTTITITFPVPGTEATCNQRVRVRVQGQYNYFFYQLLRMLGASTPSSVSVERSSEMRWEHQPGCAGGGTP